MEIVIYFEACAALLKNSVEMVISRFLPHEIFKKLTGMIHVLVLSSLRIYLETEIRVF